MTKGCAIVETRPLSNLVEIINNHLKFLPSDWRFTFFGTEENKEIVLTNFPQCNFILMHKERVYSAQSYNYLLTSLFFWSKIPYDKVLIFQHDSRLLREGIEDFLEWDFVGAPFSHINMVGGNGGLSLRSKDKALEVIRKHPYNYNPGNNEDLYFCNNLPKVGGVVCPNEIAKKFSVETIFYPNPIGVHAPEKYLSDEQLEILLPGSAEINDKKKVCLITNFYVDKNQERQKELDFCIRKNLENNIDQFVIYLSEKDLRYLLDNICAKRDKKITTVLIEERPSFNNYFSLTKDGFVNIISNLDMIISNESLSMIRRYNWDNNKNPLFALSRWDMKDETFETATFFNNLWSQDTWIFYGEMKNIPEADFGFGVLGCDNRIAYLFKQNGYNVINPSMSLKTYHYHLSNIRNYITNNTPRVPEPYLLLEPTRF